MSVISELSKDCFFVCLFVFLFLKYNSSWKWRLKWSHSVVFDSSRPHRLQPTRLPRPWDSPGKNTGVGCHFLLQCMKVKSESEVAQSYLTLRDPMDCSLPGSSAHGIFQTRVLEWVAIAFSDNLSLAHTIYFLKSSLRLNYLVWSDSTLLKN